MIFTLLSATRNAAKFAVYDETMIKVKNHQTAAASRTDAALLFEKKKSNRINATIKEQYAQ